MKGKKQDDKEKGGGERERENGHMKQLWVDLKDSSEVDNLKKKYDLSIRLLEISDS